MSNLKSKTQYVEIQEADVKLFQNFKSQTPAGGMPPTFFTRMRVGEFEILHQIGIQLNEVLHGEQEYIYEKSYWNAHSWPLAVEYDTELESQNEKSKMLFLTFMTRVREQKTKELLASSKTVMIVRRA